MLRYHWTTQADLSPQFHLYLLDHCLGLALPAIRQMRLAFALWPLSDAEYAFDEFHETYEHRVDQGTPSQSTT